MNTLYLIRHSLTAANERHLYGGSTDIPLSEKGVAIAESRRGVIPECDIYITSGMLRANQTLLEMAQRAPDCVLKGLREMDFGAFEMKSYDELKTDPDYIRWIGDESGEVRCPGGEKRRDFWERVLEAGIGLLSMDAGTACAVCHGGVIVCLMQAWFPGVDRNFYQWQPGPCEGYNITVSHGVATAFEEV